MPRFPSREWAEQYCRELNSSEAYRRSARGWVWPILFRVDMGSSKPGFILRLRDGRCEGAEWLDDASSADAPFILEASLDDWLAVIEGRLHPLTAILRQRIRLVKGSRAAIMRYPLAALEMVRAAQRVPREPAPAG